MVLAYLQNSSRAFTVVQLAAVFQLEEKMMLGILDDLAAARKIHVRDIRFYYGRWNGEAPEVDSLQH